MSTLSAETTYKAFAHCLDGDVFPPSFMAGFFGMGGDDLERVSPVLGVWQGLKRNGLLEKTPSSLQFVKTRSANSSSGDASKWRPSATVIL